MLKWQEISFLTGLADLVPRLYHLWHFIHIFSHNTERYTLFSPDPGASAVGISFIEDKWELLFVFCHLFVVYSPLPDCLQWPTCTTRWSHCSSLWNHITAPSCVTSCWGELLTVTWTTLSDSTADGNPTADDLEIHVPLFLHEASKKQRSPFFFFFWHFIWDNKTSCQSKEVLTLLYIITCQYMKLK